MSVHDDLVTLLTALQPLLASAQAQSRAVAHDAGKRDRDILELLASQLTDVNLTIRRFLR